jgi:hypothetical protein
MLRGGMREKATRKFKEFFATIQGKEKGFKGFIILENEEDSHYGTRREIWIIIILILIRDFQVLWTKLNQCSKKCLKE